MRAAATPERVPTRISLTETSATRGGVLSGGCFYWPVLLKNIKVCDYEFLHSIETYVIIVTCVLICIKTALNPRCVCNISDKDFEVILQIVKNKLLGKAGMGKAGNRFALTRFTQDIFGAHRLFSR